jgi:hypothetical protein
MRIDFSYWKGVPKMAYVKADHLLSKELFLTAIANLEKI